MNLVTTVTKGNYSLDGTNNPVEQNPSSEADSSAVPLPFTEIED
jgi:hypothetical protein